MANIHSEEFDDTGREGHGCAPGSVWREPTARQLGGFPSIDKNELFAFPPSKVA